MSRILRRPMFRGGKVSSYGNGIATGLGYKKGGSVQQRPGYVTGGAIMAGLGMLGRGGLKYGKKALDYLVKPKGGYGMTVTGGAGGTGSKYINQTMSPMTPKEMLSNFGTTRLGQYLSQSPTLQLLGYGAKKSPGLLKKATSPEGLAALYFGGPYLKGKYDEMFPGEKAGPREFVGDELMIGDPRDLSNEKPLSADQIRLLELEDTINKLRAADTKKTDGIDKIDEDKKIFAKALGKKKARIQDASNMALGFAARAFEDEATTKSALGKFFADEAKRPSAASKIDQAAGSAAINKYIKGEISKAELDKFFAQTDYKMSFASKRGKQNVAENIIEAGKTFGKGQEKFIRDYMRKAENKFNKNATILDKVYARSEKARQRAETATFTNKIENASIIEPISRLLTKHPVLKFVVPFLRTPANILKFGFDRSPFGLLKNVSKEYRRKYFEGTDIEKADALGQLSMGTLTTAATLLYLNSGSQAITGGGPRNRQERDALRETGWQPYSVKVGDTYYSYQRLDPVATMMQMAADYRDYLTYEVKDDDDRGAFELFTAMSLVYAVNLTDKTFLQGVNNMLNVMRDPEYYGPKLFKDVSSGLVPNLINQTRNTQSEIIVKEAKSFSDTLTKRVPGLDKKVAPKRNILGEEVYRANPAGLLGLVNPFYVSPDRKDLVFNEIAKTRQGYKLPSKYLFGIRDINLEEVESSAGKYDVYDRLQELTGTVKISDKTLRQYLKEVMSSKEYKNIPNLSVFETTGEKSPKIDIINNIIRAYRSKAQEQVLQENPELLERYKAAIEKGNEAFTTPQT